MNPPPLPSHLRRLADVLAGPQSAARGGGQWESPADPWERDLLDGAASKLRKAAAALERGDVGEAVADASDASVRLDRLAWMFDPADEVEAIVRALEGQVAA